MNPSSPLVFSGSTLTDLRISNGSSTPQYVLHSLRFQASRLHLYSANGSELQPEDQRDVMKFDSNVRREEYQALAPGAQLALFSAKISQSGASYSLTWGPFSFGGLAAGDYDALLEWQSSRADYQDDAGKSHELAGVWQGTLRSPHFKVKIP